MARAHCARAIPHNRILAPFPTGRGLGDGFITMTTAAPPAISRARAWLLAARPATLPAAIAPVFVGTAVAIHAGHFRALPFLAALVASVLIQVGTNFANDLFDFHKGAD